MKKTHSTASNANGQKSKEPTKPTRGLRPGFSLHCNCCFQSADLARSFFFFSLSFLMTFINNESSNVKGYLEKGKTQKPSFPLQFLTCSGKYKGEKCYLLIHVLCNPVDCSPPRFLCPWDSPGKNTEMGCHFFLHGIFLSQGSNLGLWHCRPILYRLSH